MAENNEKNSLDPSTADDSAPSASINQVISLLYGNEDPKKAYPIPVSKISELTIRESFFTKLPTLYLVLNDPGTLFNYVNFQIGNTLYVKITPVIRNKDLLPEPYVDCKFVIQSVSFYLDDDTQDYVCEINAIYPAEKYLNDICVWPVQLIDNPLTDKMYTSVEVLKNICTKGGLQFNNDYADDTNDNMSWINSHLTYSEFAEKVVKHAWINDDDMPILYVDKNGLAHFNTINTLCGEVVKAEYIQANLYDKVYRKDPSGTNQNDKPSGFRTYNDISFRNIGYIQNQGAYGIRTKIYNPYNTRELNVKEFVPDIPLKPKNTTLNDACIRNKDFHDNKKRIANLSNKSPGQVENYRYAFAKMHFKQTHEHYDYAPQHNESIKRAFFQQFIVITVDVPNQPDYEWEPVQKLALGDRITVKTESLNNVTSIQTGDYIVTDIIHNFFFNANYTMVIIAVNDGINGISRTKKESEMNKKQE